MADRLAADRVAELEKRRRDRSLLRIERRANLRDYAAHHLREKAQAGKVTDAWMEALEKRLERACGFFGSDRDLRSIGPGDVQRFAAEIAKRTRKAGEQGRTISAGTVRHYLNALSGLYRRAALDGVVDPGFNPVAAMVDKPRGKPKEAFFLEVPDVALLLESARTYRPKREDIALPHGYAMLATLFLTGARWSKVRGLLAEDISFNRSTVTIRENEFRRLKTPGSRRVIPLWPQLREVLQAHLFGAGAPPQRLLFPASRVGVEQPVTDIRKYLDRVAERAGWKPGEIRTRAARHSYVSARLQTTEGGAPVSPWTVSRELGHRSLDLVNEVYGHLGEIRVRSEVVEYRIENYRERLGERLERLRAAR